MILNLRIVLLFYLLAISTIAYGQHVKIDSLKSLLGSSMGEDRFDILYELTYEYIDYKNDTALSYANQAILETGISDSLKYILIRKLKASALRRLGILDQAMAIYKELIPIARRHEFENELRILLNSFAVACMHKGDYPKALQLHYESLRLGEISHDKVWVSVALNNIGLVNYKLNNYKKALEYYFKVLSVKKEINDSSEIDRVYINIALSYCFLGQYDQSKLYLSEAFNLCKLTCSNGILIEGEFANGVICFKTNNISEALKHFKYSYELSLKEDNRRFIAENLIYLIDIALIQGKSHEAHAFLSSFENLALNSHFSLLMTQAYKHYVRLFKNRGDYKNVSYYQNKYIVQRDSLFNEEMTNNLAAIQVEFEEQQNKAALALNEEVIKNQKVERNFVVIIVILLILLCVLLVRTVYSKKLINKMLDRKVNDRTKHLQKSLEHWQQNLEEQENFQHKWRHELSTHFNTLNSLSGLALMNVDDKTTSDSIERINRLTNDIKAGMLEDVNAHEVLENEKS